MGYEAQYTDEELATMDIKTPSVLGKSITGAKSAIISKGLTVKVVGNGDTVINQNPTEGQSVSEKGVVVLYTEQSSETKTIKMPSFMGLTVSAVNTAASSVGINVVFSGTSITSSNAVAYNQTVPADENVPVGTVVTVYFRTEDNVD